MTPMPETDRRRIFGPVRPMLEDDAIWQPVYRGMVSLVTWFCGPVFLAVGLVLILGGSK